MDVNGFIQGVSIWALPVLLAIVLHEVSHGWVAYRLGDRTAYMLGRLTLNPFRHIDPVGTVLIPLILLLMNTGFVFGYAKPVPVNFANLHHPRRDMVWVALAGPVTNLLLAIASAIVLWLATLLPESMLAMAKPLALMCQASILINMVLCIFNLLPLPPLDGGRVAVGLLPYEAASQLARVEPFGFLIIVVLLLTGVLQSLIGPLVMGGSALLINWALGS